MKPEQYYLKLYLYYRKLVNIKICYVECISIVESLQTSAVAIGNLKSSCES